ncbi:MAG TPA: hypothetical protein VKB50_16420 [Vicinamibacterales bacterium]|nr:hypothetical protein [Vicinamibacterales bacterium]
MKASRLIAALTAACLLMPLSVSTVRTQDANHAGHSDASSGPVNGPLPEAVRRATDRFRDVNAAIAAGYVQFQGCVSGQDEGAMGVHYSNFALFDAHLDVDNPEVLVYEPRNGRLHLVATEYVTPAAAWDPAHEPFDKPQLMGHLFHFVAGPNRYAPDAIYELHVWAWKNNPRGAFADWNRTVSCVEWESTP